jgi:hypothetical protein
MNMEEQAVTARARHMRVVRVAIALPALLFAVGGASDLLGGLEFWKHSRSTKAWTIGVLAFGALYVIGEAGVGWIDSRDKPSDPLWKRLLHLALLSGFAGICWAIFSSTRFSSAFRDTRQSMSTGEVWLGWCTAS